MARRAADAELARSAGRPLGFADVPERYRPSRWRDWLDDVPARVAGGRERTYAALRARADAYHAWLAEHGLTNIIGQPARGWDSTSFARWEQDGGSR